MNAEDPVAAESVDEDIPTIDDDMLHSMIEFESGMGWVPPVTLAFIVACLVVFGFELATGALEKGDRLVQMGALSAPEVDRGEWWRMLSAAFLHGGFDHIVGNMLMLFILGLACEHGFGRSQFAFLFVAAALGGSAASLIHAKVSVGASGAIFGLAGGLVALFYRHRRTLHVRDGRIGIVIAVWAIYTIALGFTDSHIDNMAHLGGFATGLILGCGIPPAILYDRVAFRKRPETLVLLSLACVALIAMSIWFIPRMIG